MHFLEQLRQALRRSFDQRLPALGIGGGGIARCPGGVVVLHGPAQFGAFAVAQNGKTLGPRGRGGGKILRPRHLHLFRGQMQQHGGFDLARVDTKAVLMGAEGRVYFLRQRQIEPAAVNHQQAMLLAQLPRHDVHAADVAAVGVKEQQFFHPGAGHTCANVAPQRQQGGRLQAQGAGKGLVLTTQANGLGGQGQGRNVGGQLRQGGGHNALGQRGIDAQGQMRAMLLGGPQGQHGNGLGGQALGLRQRKVVGRYLGPIAAGPAGQGRFSGKMGGKIRRAIGGHSPRIIDLGNHPLLP